MTTLEERLSALGNALDDHYGPITQHELTNPAQRSIGDLTVDYLQQRPDEGDASSGRRGWSGLVAAVAATILVVVGVVIVADGNSSDVATDLAGVTDPASVPNVADPVAGSSVLDTVSGYRWTRVPYDEAVFGGSTNQTELNGVVNGGPGLVAVGKAGGLWGNAAVWTSPDGITWSRVPHDEAVFGGPVDQGGGNIEMMSVTAGGPGLVAVGLQRRISPVGEAAAVWTSPDGIAWSRVPHDEAVFDRAEMWSVTAGGPGLVAVGYEVSAVSEEHATAVAWSSPDGITWSRVPDDDTLFDGAGMVSVTAGVPGLVAVGWSTERGRDVAAVWTSPDGITWSRVPHDEAVFAGAVMASVTVGGPGLVAVGFSREHDSDVTPVWTSPDGITWSRVPHDEAVLAGAEMFDVSVLGPGLVAVGLERVDEENTVGAAWTSPDGITWSRVPHDETVFGGLRHQWMWDATTVGGDLVAVGPATRDEGDFEEAAVWVATPEN